MPRGMQPQDLRSGLACLLILVLYSWGMGAQPAAHATAPLLVMLAETGRERDGVPVLRPDSGAGEISTWLSRGFSGRWLRLYQYEQEYLRRATGSRPEPAYLLLSGRRGGFPRFGFYLEDQEKRTAGYVDLFRSRNPQKRLGGMDQIFPHELAHIIMRQLAGEAPPGGSNQIHAIGVRTDPAQAFSEGFAEHCQIMAVDDPDADSETRALASDERLRRLAEEAAPRYLHELQARWSPGGPMRLGFLFWYSGTEQAWRYFAVKQNAFARQPAIPEPLLAASDLYPAYLTLNAIPGTQQDPPKSASILLSTEGIVSAFFHRWATHPAMPERYREDAFYERFGVSRSGISPLENHYLKLFHVFFVAKPQDTASLVRAYKSMYPDEAGILDNLVKAILLDQSIPDAPAIWLANPDFRTGTSLFDQYRSLPRTHTFDLNAATLVDLLSIPGVPRSLADDILKHSPYSSLNDLSRIPGLTPALLSRFMVMSEAMSSMSSGSAKEEAELNLSTILWSYGRRALILLAVASLAGAMLYARVRPVGWFRAALDGLAASSLVLGLAWITNGTRAHVAYFGPVILLGVPATLYHLGRHRQWPEAARVLLAWAVAAIPAILLAYPWL